MLRSANTSIEDRNSRGVQQRSNRPYPESERHRSESRQGLPNIAAHGAGRQRPKPRLSRRALDPRTSQTPVLIAYTLFGQTCGTTTSNARALHRLSALKVPPTWGHTIVKVRPDAERLVGSYLSGFGPSSEHDP